MGTRVVPWRTSSERHAPEEKVRIERHGVALVALFAFALGVTSAGCGDDGERRGAPPTPTPVATATLPLTATPTSTPVRAVRVLMFSRTTGFRHDSIADAKQVLGNLSPEQGIEVVSTEDPAEFRDDRLSAFDVIAFVNTTGEILDDSQQAAMERFVRAGGGFVGVHSAADTEYDWPWYGRLVGAYFRSHPLLPVDVEVTTEDASHPATAHLQPKFRFTDEIYNFDRNPRKDNSILLTIDEAGFIYPNTDGGPSMGADHPVAWFKEFDGGRSFYTNFGHRPETWYDPRFIEHLLEGIRWAAQPAQYNRIVLTDFAANPMHLAVAPDSRVFYIERTGEVRVWSPLTGRVTEAAKLTVDTSFENGLLGIALDPQFADNHWVYLYHSVPVPSPPPASGPPGENVLSRFTLSEDGILDLESRVDLLRVPSERQLSHEGGGLAFAPDGTIYVSTGDNTDPFASDGYAPIDERPGRERYNAQRTAANPFDLRGKILRIKRDGSIPSGNLFPSDGTQGRPEIFVMGCRNPFRIAVDPSSGRLFWGDVGPDALRDGTRGPRGYDEMNFADSPGDYGWPHCIADNKPYADFDFATNTVGPLFDCTGKRPATIFYDYLTVSYLALGDARDPEGRPSFPGVALTGRLAIAGAFYPRAAAAAPFALPAEFHDTLIMTEWSRDILAVADIGPDGDLRSLKRFLPWESFIRPIDVEVGPDGALYVLEYGSGYAGDNDDARLSRVEYSQTGELTPVAAIQASALQGRPPLTVTFTAFGSRAPGDTIAAYEWDLDGDGSIDATGPEANFTYQASGGYAASLVVVGTSGRRSFPSVVTVVVGNTPPEVVILEPADGNEVLAGSEVQLRGSGTDAESGVVPCDELVWDVRLGHNAHTHPLASGKGCEFSFIAQRGDHSAETEVYFIVELSHRDRGGPNGEPPLTGRSSIRINFAREIFTPTPTPVPTPTPDIDLQPVFAEPGTPLNLDWGSTQSAAVDLGDGTIVDPSVRQHDYGPENRVYTITGTAGGLPVEGAVARTTGLAASARGAVLFIKPDIGAAGGILSSFVPAMQWAITEDRLAIAAQVSPAGNLHFTDVSVLALTINEDGTFLTDPGLIAVEPLDFDDRPSGVQLRFQNTVVRGTLAGLEPAGNLRVAGDMVLDDLIDAAARIGNINRAAALALIAGVLQFDSQNPPEVIPSELEFLLD